MTWPGLVWTSACEPQNTARSQVSYPDLACYSGSGRERCSASPRRAAVRRGPYFRPIFHNPVTMPERVPIRLMQRVRLRNLWGATFSRWPATPDQPRAVLTPVKGKPCFARCRYASPLTCAPLLRAADRMRLRGIACSSCSPRDCRSAGSPAGPQRSGGAGAAGLTRSTGTARSTMRRSAHGSSSASTWRCGRRAPLDRRSGSSTARSGRRLAH